MCGCDLVECCEMTHAEEQHYIKFHSVAVLAMPSNIQGGGCVVVVWCEMTHAEE